MSPKFSPKYPLKVINIELLISWIELSVDGQVFNLGFKVISIFSCQTQKLLQKKLYRHENMLLVIHINNFGLFEFYFYRFQNCARSSKPTFRLHITGDCNLMTARFSWIEPVFWTLQMVEKFGISIGLFASWFQKRLEMWYVNKTV